MRSDLANRHFALDKARKPARLVATKDLVSLGSVAFRAIGVHRPPLFILAGSGAGAIAEDIVPRRRVAQAAAEIRTIGQGQHPEGQPHACAAAAAPGRAAGVEAVPRRAIDAVDRVGAKAEFGRVGLADEDGAGGAQPLHHYAFAGGDLVLVDQRTVGGPDADHVGQILHRPRQAEQRPRLLSGAEPRIHRARLGQQPITILQRDDGIMGRIMGSDLRQHSAHHLNTACLARRDQGGDAPARHCQQRINGCSRQCRSRRHRSQCTSTHDEIPASRQILPHPLLPDRQEEVCWALPASSMRISP